MALRWCCGGNAATAPVSCRAGGAGGSSGTPGGIPGGQPGGGSTSGGSPGIGFGGQGPGGGGTGAGGVRWGFRDLQDEDDHALTMGLGRSQFDRGAAMPPVA
ncbi:MAG TPA: hypothetical protein EYP07_13435 [Kiloniellaceae bacterium]|nr:hypothetical protein [Kiloniellaceae bacterium]